MAEPRIQYAKTSDGVNVAYAVSGNGPPLIYLPACWESMGFRAPPGTRFFDALAESHTLVQYDRRGTGQSDRDVGGVSLDTDLTDLAAVTSKLGLTMFALFASFHLGPAAITYAARNPDKVSHIILYGTFANGGGLTTDQVKASIMSMVQSHWGMARRQLADITAPGVAPEVLDWIINGERYDVSSERVVQLLELLYRTDVRDQLPRVQAPTLVLHRRGERAMPYRASVELATLIPEAEMISLEGAVHWPWLGDSDAVLRHVLPFLGGGEVQAQTGAGDVHPGGRAATVPTGAPSSTVRTILFTDLTASTALTQRLGDAKAQELVRAHNTIVREALAAQGGSEIKHTGDGIMASFPTASGALECAVAIQRGIAEEGARQASPLRVHIGVNAGEPVAEESDLFGTSVQLARRICDHAESGQILVSNVVRELAAGKGFLFADIGEVAPKGFEEPVRLCEVRWRDDA